MELKTKIQLSKILSKERYRDLVYYYQTRQEDTEIFLRMFVDEIIDAFEAEEELHEMMYGYSSRCNCGGDCADHGYEE